MLDDDQRRRRAARRLAIVAVGSGFAPAKGVAPVEIFDAEILDLLL